LAGHFGPDIGRAMEDSFVSLLYRLGYIVHEKCGHKTGLDVIAEFYGEPIDPKPTYPCNLLPPFFAPSGIIAFSLKRSYFSKKDIAELVTKVNEAKKLKDPVLSSIKGKVIATNISMKESAIDSLFLQKIYCWDSRRLFFYAAKAQTIQNLASKGPVTETSIDDFKQASCIVEIETSEKLKNTLLANVTVFIDDHSKELTVGSQHMEKILTFVYEKSLKQIAERTKFDLQVSLSVQVLGIVNETVIKNTYKKYVMETASHPRVFFPAELVVFQYGAAPWSILFM
jgi:hypothetical protein